jgi:hypothetical protein
MCVKPNMYYNIIIKIWEFPMLILIQYVNDGRSYLSRFLKFLVMSCFPRIAHDKINRMYDIVPFSLTPNLRMFKT